MEANRVQCSNLGMVRDDVVSSMHPTAATSASAGTPIQYAFENHNIRIMAVNDNTKFSVTNEKSTKKVSGDIRGVFMGGCVLNQYLTIFTKVPLDQEKPDFIYRMHYNGETVDVVELYNGNLNFDLEHPIEALGYYESAEVQKVYWVDGLNQNRFINISKSPYVYYAQGTPPIKLRAIENKNRVLDDGVTLYALVDTNNEIQFYSEGLEHESRLWRAEDVHAYFATPSIHTFEGLAASYETYAFDASDNWIGSTYTDTSFDFQGPVSIIPSVTITKDYNKAGTFQAGVLQYFITYYNKYGVETCIVWSSDLQYLSLPNRGAKADEAVVCGFDIAITNVDTSYEYLRLYSSYRSGINGVVTSKIVREIDLTSYASTDTLRITDMGDGGISIDSNDLKYIGGQNVIANTLDYKQDTLFLGDITIDGVNDTLHFAKSSIPCDALKDAEGNPVSLQEGGIESNGTFTPFVRWAYKYVGSTEAKGTYQYNPEILESQEDIAGFKWREVYRFGIQFMSPTGEWTSAYWLSDKYCDLKPQEISKTDLLSDNGELVVVQPFGCNQLDSKQQKGNALVLYSKEGCYIATAVVDIATILSSGALGINNTYTAYRLLVVEPSVANRRIVTQGVVNPTMFNYRDRESNKPFSIPSWIFRPRGSEITHTHYDTLPVQTESAAELQGIVERQIPGFIPEKDDNAYNAYMLIIGANAATLNKGFAQWKLIYYNCGKDAEERAERAFLALWTGKLAEDDAAPSEDEYRTVASLLRKYKYSVGLGYSSDINAAYPDAEYSKNAAGGIYPLGGLVDGKTDDQIVELLKNGYYPAYVYGSNYLVVSAGKAVSRKKKNGDIVNGTFHSWEKVWGDMCKKIEEDMKATTKEQVGELLAGQTVVYRGTLPSPKELEDLAELSDENAQAIGMAIAAAIATAAAIVISAVSMGTLAPPAMVGASMAIGAAVSACAGVAIGAGSAALVSAKEKEDLADVYKTLLSKGFVSASCDDEHAFSLKARQHQSLFVARTINKFFAARRYVLNNKNGDWYVPVLNGETNNPYASPFTTRHPYTETGCLGENWNAVIRTGVVTTLSESEDDLKKKANLFCVDESIVTLNAPDVEDISYVVDGSDALQLDLVGVIPIDAVYGDYSAQIANGLNSNSQLIQGRIVADEIGSASTSGGLLNGDIYQDFKPKDEQFDSDYIVANEDSGVYRLFMWNRSTSAGFWFPGITLKDGFEQDILSPRSKLNRKTFANLRYSVNTEYYTPYTMSIDIPQVCMDAQNMLKQFTYGGVTCNYYENVDTISLNTTAYPLIADRLKLPSSSERITKGALKDPVHIRYKETPHVLIPFEWNGTDGAYSATLLPYISAEDQAIPEEMYEEVADNPDYLFFGEGERPLDTNQYYYLKAMTIRKDADDPWERTRIEVDFAKAVELFAILGTPFAQTFYSLRSQYNLSAEELIDKLYGSASDGDVQGNKLSVYWTSTQPHHLSVLLDKRVKYLIQISTTHYYVLSFQSTKWYCEPLQALPLGAKVSYYTLQGADSNGTCYAGFTSKVHGEGDAMWFSMFPSAWMNIADYSDYTPSTQGGPWYSIVKPAATDALTQAQTVYSTLFGNSKWRYIYKGSLSGSYGLRSLDGNISLPLGGYARTRASKTPNDAYFVINKTLDEVVLANLQDTDVCSVFAPAYKDYNIVQIVKKVDYKENGQKVGDAYIVNWTPPGTIGFNRKGVIKSERFPASGDFLSMLGTSADMDTKGWTQRALPWSEPSSQYLFLGELVKKNFDYSSWNGGTGDKSLQNLVWNVASGVTPIDTALTRSWGDTFYQRWDCLKTYPFTEEDPNSVVEVLSFMLESHSNLDGRADINRGTANLLTTRPSNTVYNPVYGQQDNFFTYQTFDSKFEKNHFEADVMWSLTKNNLDDVDKWTSLIASNEMSLDGRYGAVRKILNVNDSLMTFQDTGIAQIKYNEAAALNTTTGLPVQLGNTGKVDGYRMISDTIGCHNKFSINKNSAGVFFADDHNKSFNQLTLNGGIASISTTAGFSVWFKKNLPGSIWNAKDRDNFRTSYDEVTHDLYLIRKDTCLVYNTLLQKFTSFMDYVDTPMITRLISDNGASGSFAVRSTQNDIRQNVIEVWQMFADIAEYGYIYGEFKPYSMEYRITPDAAHDSIFTNYQYAADWTDPAKEVDEDNIFDTSARRYTTFDTVEAKDEYQYGIMSIQQQGRIQAGYNRVFGRQPVKSMFRLWRGDVPRDGDGLNGEHTPMSDRMRNPWIHLKFEKSTEDDSKMTFHNLLVTYYNQYGRF